MSSENNTILEVANVNKYFPGVHALDNVNFSLRKGEVHALLGENGAGKSTLIKILAGVYNLDSGEILVDGKKVEIEGVCDSEELGISVIYQELALSQNMTVAENIFMGREPTNIVGVVNYRKMRKDAQLILDNLGTSIRSNIKVSSLSIAHKQVVEIAKALSVDARIIVMDEPTASLSQEEVDRLFETIAGLKQRGVAIIYISHRMEELFKVADRVTILRDGKYIDTKEIQNTSKEDLVRLMVGRELIGYYTREESKTEEILLEVQDVNTEKVKNISLKVNKGEIVGIAGLIGAGRTELANAIFGIDEIESGKIILEGKEIRIKGPMDAIQNGIVLVPESRKDQGLILVQSVMFNITICVLDLFIKNFFRVSKKAEKSIVDEFIAKLKIKASSRRQHAVNLSGGNQQKIVLAKWLATKPKVLILDEPTRGIDVGAKAEIYALMNDLAKQGNGIIMISSELPEIINMSDKVYVMSHGEIRACFTRDEISQEDIISAAIGVE